MNKVEPYTDNWNRKAGLLAINYCPSIYPCRTCGNPVIKSYCCTYCNDNDPSVKKENKKYYKTTYTISVLSKEPIPENIPLVNVLQEADTGAYVGASQDKVQETLAGKQMANALYEAGSEPRFFMLNDNGEEEE